MRLLRFGPKGSERPGIELQDGSRKDCSSLFEDWNGAFFADDGIIRLRRMAGQLHDLPDVPADARIGPCVARPWKVICVGLNYSDHAEESGMAIPSEPVIFMKGSNTVVGPYDDIIIPRESRKTDWEVELGVVIARECRYLQSERAALEAVAGYCVSHDVSEREFQLERAGQWVKGKSCDTFNPLGPVLVTPDAIPDPQALDLWLDVNGKPRQRGNTRTMIFSVAKIIHYVSQFMTLEPGDVISTGTPPGVGFGLKPPVYLEPGDVVELGIAGLGSQRQVCRASS
ncbi:MAG TPA: fumarylacetoacetate hydrolase family protein [Steroidobacter sp.]|jgi:2-keto-4-pentenoate hydratase/2-oxohepta-3-ene-1,7-dioic acid hydratase in catechol pathway